MKENHTGRDMESSRHAGLHQPDALSCSLSVSRVGQGPVELAEL